MQSNKNFRKFATDSNNELYSWYVDNKNNPPSLFKHLSLEFTLNNIKCIANSIICDRPEFICQPTMEDLPEAMRVYVIQQKAISSEKE